MLHLYGENSSHTRLIRCLTLRGCAYHRLILCKHMVSRQHQSIYLTHERLHLRTERKAHACTCLSCASHVHLYILITLHCRIVTPTHIPAGQGLVVMRFEEYVGLDASHAIWQTIAHHLGGQNLASIRAVCRTSRKAVDDAVIAIAVSKDAVQGTLPRHERFSACKQYTFIDPSEGLPQYIRQRCSPRTEQKSVLICGEACWRAPRVQDWIQFYRDEFSWVGLVLRLCEEHQDDDVSAYLGRILAVGDGIPLFFLGLWCELSSLVIVIRAICGCLSQMC
jgi:hypothetical protein